MGFTKAQRLKGLKKQLRNMGYDIVGDGSASSADEPVSTPSSDVEMRGRKVLDTWNQREEGF